ncbi:hypothetical protein MPL3356_100023 [Mesorhizobium plurifarium]|uniref:Uncharacterized protein n=1 Tax=Mesorhizobium plurifarium TaxID=69974 RepID=A0A090EWI8_MESPL|nr:hypothetical protein MPL3356_100023 [Mesorhizobium plurifarium]
MSRENTEDAIGRRCSDCDISVQGEPEQVFRTLSLFGSTLVASNGSVHTQGREWQRKGTTDFSDITAIRSRFVLQAIGLSSTDDKPSCASCFTFAVICSVYVLQYSAATVRIK